MADQIKFTPVTANFKNSHNGALLDVSVTKVSGGPADFLAYVYCCHLVEDNDGAPRCYGWDNPTNLFIPYVHWQQWLEPLDRLGNATSPYKNWDAGSQDFYWAGLYAVTEAFARDNGLVIDRRRRLRAERADPHDGARNKFPVVQGFGQPAPGYYVSTTAQPANPSLPRWDQNRYWNAAEVPYAVWAKEWETRGTGVALGDFGLAIKTSTGRSSPFAFRDSGTSVNVGECSRYLCRTLTPTPEHHALYNEDFVSFLVFPGSRSRDGAFVTFEQIAKLAEAENGDELALFLALGADLGRFKAVLRRMVRGDSDARFSLGEYVNVLWALRVWGYPTDLDFHPVEHSVNL